VGCAGDMQPSVASVDVKRGNEHGGDECGVHGDHVEYADGGSGRQVGVSPCTHHYDSIHCDRGDNEAAVWCSRACVLVEGAKNTRHRLRGEGRVNCSNCAFFATEF